MSQGINGHWSTLPKEHPFGLSERDVRRTITRLEHWLEQNEDGDETERRHVSIILNHLRDAYREIDHVKQD